MDLRKLKKLIDLVQESGVAELEVKEGEESVRITRAVANQQTVYFPQAAMPQMAPMSPAAASRPTLAAPAEAPAPAVEGHVVKSPMVGTFYRSPTPNAEPFVNECDRVESGQTLCILEAMKLFNELKAEQGGVIRAVLVKNGEPVEFGQPLFELEPA